MEILFRFEAHVNSTSRRRWQLLHSPACCRTLQGATAKVVTPREANRSAPLEPVSCRNCSQRISAAMMGTMATPVISNRYLFCMLIAMEVAWSSAAPVDAAACVFCTDSTTFDLSSLPNVTFAVSHTSYYVTTPVSEHRCSPQWLGYEHFNPPSSTAPNFQAVACSRFGRWPSPSLVLSSLTASSWTDFTSMLGIWLLLLLLRRSSFSAGASVLGSVKAT